MTAASPPAHGLRPPAAIITYGSTRRALLPGQSLTFGRGAGHDIRIGHEPPDLRIPRFAGRLKCRPDGVLIHNTSDKRTITMRPFPGPVLEIQPLTLVGTVPHHMVQLVLHGQSGSQFAINIDTRDLQPAAQTTNLDLDPVHEEAVGYTRITDLKVRERQLLTALCLPAWSGLAGSDEVPSYQELDQMFRARGIAVSAKRLRNALDALRRRLSDDYGVYSTETTGPAGGKQSFLPTLAHWARISGNIAEEELERFDDVDLT
jgi:hypothetical protein